jgi:hypothetical protein
MECADGSPIRCMQCASINYRCVAVGKAGGVRRWTADALSRKWLQCVHD